MGQKAYNLKVEELNRLGEQITTLDRTADEAVWQSLWYSIYVLSLELFPGKLFQVPRQYMYAFENGFHEAMIETLTRFDAQKSPLYPYLKRRIENRYKDALRKHTNDSSLDAPVGEEDNNDTLANLIEGGESASQSVEDTNFIDSQLFELASLMLLFSKRHRRKSDEEKLNFFRLFYTSGIVSFLQMEKASPEFEHESQILSVMKLPFVDFCMITSCKTLLEIQSAQLKNYGQVVDCKPGKADADDPIRLPIPDTVGRSYLKREEKIEISASGYSQRKKQYIDEMESALKKRAE